MLQIVCTIKLCKHDRNACARADYDEQKQIHQAPGYAHGGESQGTGVSSDHPCVDRIIELLEDVAENKRKREPDQLCRHALSA